ncbi:hypothetical protein FSW04_01205 [Baekduia soli]|uniref:DUF3352 domain-containing protein n=1 Tax=Baekduia soli TaxID=496014 RepID=A0A5B8U017_9ACTN|nr:hypothetical protein [Baekduia soli]QEC46329.1 hypothetical protein FSW04_01205 [Baekduia soli]
MPRRPLILALVAALAVAGVVVYLVTRGGGQPQRAVGDPLAEALAYAPASSEVVADVDLTPGSPQRDALTGLARTFPAARFASGAVPGALRPLGLDADADLPRILGGPLVIAGSKDAATALTRAVTGLQLDLVGLLRTGAVAAVTGRSASDVAGVFSGAVKDGRMRALPDLRGAKQYALPDDGGRVAVRGPDVVLAGTSARLGQALALRDRQGGLSAATFAARLGPLSGPALVRVAAQPRVLIGDRAHGVPFVDALRGGALALSVASPGLRLHVHLTTDPAGLRAQDLPLAPGAAPPSPAPGVAALSAGARGLDQTIRLLDAVRKDLDVPLLAPVTGALDTLDSVKGPLKTFGRIDADAALIDQLSGTTTFTREPGGIAIRAELRDGGPLRTALNRIAAIPDVAISLAGVTDLDLDKAGDDAYEVRRKGTTFLKLAVLGNTLVVSTDLNAGLRAIADRRPAPGADRRARGAGAARHGRRGAGPACQPARAAAAGAPRARRVRRPRCRRLRHGGRPRRDRDARAEPLTPARSDPQ